MVNTMYHIYVIQNTITLKLYVGLTKNPQRRWKGHRTNANVGRKKNRLYDAMRSYGNDAFTFTIIEDHDTPEACAEAECFWIAFFRSWDPAFGYNLNHGGTLGLPTEETRRKMSESARRRGANNKGKKFSEEARGNMKLAQNNRSEVWQENLRSALQQRDESWRQNVGRAPKSPEWKRKLSESVRAAYARKKAMTTDSATQ
jgi:group I intron endonuclease